MNKRTLLKSVNDVKNTNQAFKLKSEMKAMLNHMENLHDAWQNINTGAGIMGKDRKADTIFNLHNAPSREELAALYRLDGLTRKVINSPIKSMIKNWIYISGDEDNLIQKELRRLKAKSAISEVLRWQDVFGGGVIVMVIDDSIGSVIPEQGVFSDKNPFMKPLNINNIRKVNLLKVYEKDEIVAEKTYSVNDSIDKAGMPEIYRISPMTGGSPFSVHESRCLVFDGEEITSDVRANNNGWGDSRLTSIYDRLRGVSEGYSNLERVIEEFIIGVWKKPNMRAIVASGRKQLVQDEMNLFDMARHILNTVMIDDKESYDRLTATVNGLSDIMTKLEISFAGVVDMPVSILFGDSAKGLNASGSDNQQMLNYYESLAARQEDEMREPLEYLCYLIMLSKEGLTKGQLIDEWELEFNPIATPTLNETLDAQEKQARIDKIYWDMGALTEQVIKENRFGGEEYSFKTDLTLVENNSETEQELEQEPEDMEN
jgi:hypothetical protein